MLTIPLNITPTGLEREVDIKRSLNESIQLLLMTPRYGTLADPMFGFVFNNLRFEIFNEQEGMVYNSSDSEEAHGLAGLYDKKVSGSSKNMNTFAAELKSTIMAYEPRLTKVSATMTYIREERLIYVTVKGVIAGTQEDYTYTTTIKVWK